MSGIFALLNTNNNDNTYEIIIKKQFMKCQARSPEYLFAIKRFIITNDCITI